MTIMSTGLPFSGALGNGTNIITNSVLTRLISIATPTIVTIPDTGARWQIPLIPPPINAPVDWVEDGTLMRRRSTKKIKGNIPVSKVSSGLTHTLVLSDDKMKVFGFGSNQYGSLVIAVGSQNKTSPFFSSSSDSDTDAYFSDLELNLPTVDWFDYRREPVPVFSQISDTVDDIGSGIDFSLFLSGAQKVLSAVGRNLEGRLGIGNSLAPYIDINAKVVMVNVKTFRIGGRHTVVLNETGSVFVFGSNEDGRYGLTNITAWTTLGNKFESHETISYSNIPIPIDLRPLLTKPGPKPSNVNVKHISASYYSTMILLESNWLVVMGTNILGAQGKGVTYSRVVLSGVVDDVGNNKDLFSSPNISRYELTYEAVLFDLKPMIGSSQVDIMTACENFALFLLNNGSVIYFGKLPWKTQFDYGLLDDPIFNQQPITSFSCGRRHMAVVSDKKAFTIGYNSYGQLGTGNFQNSYSFSQIMNGVSVTSVECGFYSTFFIDENKFVWAFGSNSKGELGTMGDAAKSLPSLQMDIQLSISNNPIISAGPFQSFINTIDVVYATGWNNNKMLNFPVSTERLYKPTQVYSGVSNIVNSCATMANTFSLDAAGKVYTIGADTRYLKQVSFSLVKIKDLACGALHALFVSHTGRELFAIGQGSSGQLGNGTYYDSNTPVRIGLTLADGETITSIAGGASHSIVSTSLSNVYTFGDNSFGQLGVGTILKSFYPLKVDLPVEVAKVEAGWYHSLVLSMSGTVYAFGRNNFGQLGTNTDSSSSSYPTAVYTPSELSDVVDVRGGALHTLLLTGHGEVLGYGSNAFGQLGSVNVNQRRKPTSSSSPVLLTSSAGLESRTVVMIAAGAFHSVMLTLPSSDICPKIMCNGISRDSAQVCNFRNGTCIFPGKCVCKQGYYGSNCELGTCNGIPGSSPEVCNGNGTCTSDNVCVCNHNHTGSNCMTLIYDDKSIDATTVALSVVLPIAGVFAIIVLIIVFVLVSVGMLKKEKRRKSEESTSNDISGMKHTEDMSDGSLDKEMQLLPNTPSSNSLCQTQNIRTFMNLSQVSTAVTLTRSMMDGDPGGISQTTRLNGGESMLIDRFVNLMKIGQGSFGMVFKAQDTKQNNAWKAIKLIRFSGLNELNQTLREATHLLRMVHPNIVRVNDVFIDANQQMLCMEMDYYELGDLEKFLQNQMFLGSFTLSEAIVGQLIQQIAAALHYMNSEFNMVHRDVKPSNVFIKSYDFHNQSIQIVLGDFGLAKKGWRNSITLSDTSSAIASLPSSESSISNELLLGDAHTLLSTQLGFAGTPIFMSWEAAVHGKYCFQTDVFSVGVTAYQCLTGDYGTCITQLYLREHQQNQVLKPTQEQIPVEHLIRTKIRNASPQCSEELIDLVMLLLKKEPEERPTPKEVLNMPYFANK